MHSLVAAQAPLPGAGASSTSTASSKPTGKLGYFQYNDANSRISAKIFLPESMGEWAVENPWRNADKSLINDPQVFVVANFQNVSSPRFFGLIRVSYDLHGYDCGVVFKKLAELDGLSLEKYSETDVQGIKGGKVYVLAYASKDRTATSKLVCDEKSAVELFVVAPSDGKFAEPMTTIVGSSELTIAAMAD